MEALKISHFFLLWFMCSTVLFLNAMQPCFAFTSFVFGDSLVDAGNNDYMFTLSKADSPPDGIDFKPSGGHPTGRFTNGRTISDIVGFENANEPCCGGYFPPFICFKSSGTNRSSALCTDRLKYVFWDAYHPTEAANMIMAKGLLDGDGSVSYPINIRNELKVVSVAEEMKVVSFAGPNTDLKLQKHRRWKKHHS